MEEITGFDEQIGFFNPFKVVKKATQNIQKNIVKRTPVMPTKKASQSSFFNRLAQRTKMVQAAQSKKLLPNSFYNNITKGAKMVQAAPIKKASQKSFFSNINTAGKQAKLIHNLKPSPQIVKQLTPVQRSFLNTDLPYKVLSRNNFGQPKTQFIPNTPYKFDISIDQIEPPVDSGISNYYGK